MADIFFCRSGDLVCKFMGITCNKLLIIIVWVWLIASEIKNNTLMTQWDINKHPKKNTGTPKAFAGQ